METPRNNFGESNPKEFITLFSGSEANKSTLAIESFFSKADAYDKCSPQQIYNPTFSRFKFTIISKKSAKTANMPVSDFADVEARTIFIRNKIYEMEMMPDQPAAQSEELSSAYTQRFINGEFKGKTPAQVLLENPENQEKLNKQYQLLKANLEKYQNNQKIMDAIKDAAALFKAGKLENKQQSENVFNIYTPGFRPLTRKKREDGKCPVYDMSIKCYPGNKYPIEISVTNYYAPFTVCDNGTIRVNVKEMDKETLMKGVVNLTLKDWNNIIARMKEQKDSYVSVFAEDRFKEADRLYSENMRRSQNYIPEEE